MTYGDEILLKPNARIHWLVWAGPDEFGQVNAMRLDNEIGAAVLAWTKGGRKGTNCPNRGQVSSVSRTFASSELKDAVVVASHLTA